MYLSLLLPLLLASGPGQPAAATADDPPIQIWINNDGRFLRGDRAKVHVRTEDDGYLVVLHADAEGHLRVLFPLDPTDDNFVRGGKKYEVEGRGGRDAFDVGDRSGRGSVYAAVSRTPFRFDEFVLSDHWDYKALEPRQLAEDPEPELTELVRRMAQGSFDYDVMSYYVVDRVVYANDYSYAGRTTTASTTTTSAAATTGAAAAGSRSACSFGRPFYRRHYYSPFHYAYDPFYDPFFYDPYYYRPYYYRPYYYRPVYYPGHYWGYPYHYRNAGYYNRWDRAFTPYRFRDRTLANADYRDRRYTFGRAVNTVYTPPVSRFSEPDNASPIRRAVDRHEGERPEAASPGGPPTGPAQRRRRRELPSSDRPGHGAAVERAERVHHDRGPPRPAGESLPQPVPDGRERRRQPAGGRESSADHAPIGRRPIARPRRPPAPGKLARPRKPPALGTTRPAPEARSARARMKPGRRPPLRPEIERSGRGPGWRRWAAGGAGAVLLVGLELERWQGGDRRGGGGVAAVGSPSSGGGRRR